MQYKTIVLELLEQRPALHSALKASRSLLSTMNQMAADLRESHLTLTDLLRAQNPHVSDIQLKSEAMELALEQFTNSLPMEETQTVSMHPPMQRQRPPTANG